jgi:hypothetical protein
MRVIWERAKQIVKWAKDFNSWYSFGSNIVKLIVWIGLLSGGGGFVVGVPAAIIKGVPWPITLMASLSMLISVGCLVATPLIIRVAIQATRPLSEPNKAPEPIRPHWDAWKIVDRFTVYEAACLFVNLEPSTHQGDPRIEPWMNALRAAIRKGDLEFILDKSQLDTYNLDYDWKSSLTKIQREEASSTTEIQKAALIDFAKRNNIDLKYLGK